MADRFIYKHRRGTTEQWATSDSIIYDGEIVVEKPNDGYIRLKVGDGTKKFSELPYMPKPDWNQTDDTKADYIKNRPFYEDTLVNITWDGDTIGKTEVDLSSVVGFNAYLVSDATPSVEDLTGSTVTVYDGSSSMEFSVRSVQTPSDNIIIVLDGYAFVILKDNSEFNGIVFPSKGTYFANGGATYVSRITKKVINQIDPKFINMDSFPKELLKITVTSSDSTYSADKTDSDIKSCLDNGGIPYIALYDTVFIYEGYSSDIGYMFIDTNDGKMLCIYHNSVSLYSSNLKSKLDSTVSTTAQTLTDEQKTQARTNIGGADISLGISGATAGQMAKVKAVDASGAPTAWEAGDAAGGYSGYGNRNPDYTYTVTEVISELYISEINGNTFSANKLACLVEFPAGTGGFYYHALYTLQGSRDKNYCISNNNAPKLSDISTKDSVVFFIVEKLNNQNYKYNYSGQCKNRGQELDGTYGTHAAGIFPNSIEGETSIKSILLKGQNAFGVGVKISIWLN